MSGTPAVATAEPGAAIPALDTVRITGLDVMLPGNWTGIKGGTNRYDVAKLQGMAAAFRELRDVIRPVVKLGHGSQALLQNAELPNGGVFENLYVSGNRLKVDLAGVPAQLAALIKTGNIGARSLELLFDVDHGGKRYEAVVTGLALLGESRPAVTSLNDILALYQHADEPDQVLLSARDADVITLDEEDAAMPTPARKPRRVALAGPAFDEIRNAVEDELEECYPYRFGGYDMPSGMSDADDGPSPCIEMLYADSVVVWDQDHDELWLLPYTYDAGTAEAELGEPQRCRLVPQMITGTPAELAAKPKGDVAATPAEPDAGDGADYGAAFDGMDDALGALAGHLDSMKGKAGVGSARMMHRELAGKVKTMRARYAAPQAAALAAPVTASSVSLTRGEETMQDSDIREYLGLEPSQDIKQALLSLKGRTVELSAHNAVVAELSAYKQRDAEREAAVMVDQAIDAGKLVATQRDWALRRAVSDPEDFGVFLSAQPQVWPGTGEVGATGNATGRSQTEATVLIARKLGVTDDQLADTRSTAQKYAEVLSKKGVNSLYGGIAANRGV